MKTMKVKKNAKKNGKRWKKKDRKTYWKKNGWKEWSPEKKKLKRKERKIS